MALTRTDPLLITAALPYANGSIHIGYLLEAIQTDVYARAQRMEGREVLYVCAEDTHGTPIELNARKAGVPPETFVQRFYEEHLRDLKAFDIEHAVFHTTHSPESEKWVHFIYQGLKAGGHLQTRPLEQLFDEEAERFLPDRFVKGTCPVCGTDDQYGDVCEACGSTYEPTELKNPKSVVTGSTPVLRSSEHVFVGLGSFADFLQAWVGEDAHLQPEVRNFVQGWLERGLQPWCISRDAPYFGFEVPELSGKYFYVWMDAPVGYIGATDKWAQNAGTPDRVDSLWKGEEAAELIHVIGKDIVYFHTLFWPAMLKAAGLRTPDRVQVHGMVMLNKEKMSKTRGTFILARTFLDHLSPVYLRWYYASKLGPGIEDFDFSTEEFTTRVNAELVNNLANLASRGTNFLHQKLEGRFGPLVEDAKTLEDLAEEKTRAAREAYRNWDFGAAVRAALDVTDAGNLLFQERQPWKLVKKDPEAARRVVSTGLVLARTAAVLLQPVVPSVTATILRNLGLPERASHFDEALRFGDLSQGHEIGPPLRVVDRMNPKSLQAIIEAGRPKDAEPEGSAQKGKSKKAKKKESARPPAEITIDELSRVLLKVGLVVEARPVEDADKLLELSVDVGEDKPRRIFAGLAQAYRPEELRGRRVVVAANLAHRKMRFGTSEGMVLAAGPGGADIQVLTVSDDAPPGSLIK
ncbi:MAG: methionine--tRNA ligase [Myxococcota bacterium]